MKCFFFCLLMLATLSGLSAVSPTPEFGEVSSRVLNSTHCPIDSNAHAYIVFDKGKLLMNYTGRKAEWELNHRRRIKILSRDGLNWATVLIPYSRGEKISNIRAVTINAQGSEKLKTAISNKNIYYELIGPGLAVAKFTMPNAREGSVIDLEYTISSSKIFNIRDWDIQQHIPVIYNELQIYPSPFMIYNLYPKGGFKLSSEINPDDSYWNTSEVTHITAESIEALKYEDYTDNIENYRAGIEFILAWANFAGHEYSYAWSWQDVIDRIYQQPVYKRGIKSNYIKRSELKLLTTNDMDPYQKMQKIFDHVKNNMTWNGGSGIYPGQKLKKEWRRGIGNAAAINLLLVSMLKTAGLKASPVLISTKDHGRLMPDYPDETQFNYVIAAVDIDGKPILLDGTNKHSTPGILPQYCYNKKGMLLSEEETGWIDIIPEKKLKLTNYYQLVLDSTGTFRGKLNMKAEEYSAYLFRNRFNEYLNPDQFIEETEVSNPGMNILDFHFEAVDKCYEPTGYEYELIIRDHCNFYDAIMGFNPFFYEKFEARPFVSDERTNPVDFGIPMDITSLFIIQLPENTDVENLPLNTKIVTPDNSSSFSFSSDYEDGKLEILVHFVVERSWYEAIEYPFLREFYNLLLAKQSEQILLKMKTSQL